MKRERTAFAEKMAQIAAKGANARLALAANGDTDLRSKAVELNPWERDTAQGRYWRLGFFTRLEVPQTSQPAVHPGKGRAINGRNQWSDLEIQILRGGEGWLQPRHLTWLLPDKTPTAIKVKQHQIRHST